MRRLSCLLFALATLLPAWGQQTPDLVSSLLQDPAVKAALEAGSTDANYAMSLQIPAIAVGGGGNGTGAHSLGESFDAANSWQGTQRALLLVIALVQNRTP